MIRIYELSIIFILLLVEPLSVLADMVDQAWEQQTAEKLAVEADSTEAIWLEANGNKFLTLFTSQTSARAHGAVIILHGMGSHADWPHIISPVRTMLPIHGWTTLSIQLPVIAPSNQIEDYGKTLKEASERIKAGVRLLRQRKFLNIVAIGHSYGAVNILNYLNNTDKTKVLALVAIGLQDYAFVKPPIDVLKLIEETNIPILDIYGSRDFKRVIEQAADRRLAAKKGNNLKYEQVEIEGADHYFMQMQDILVKRIRGWLDKAAPGVSIMVDEEFDGNTEETEEKPSE
jgi:pimeloyl-ACP methyl ester carboxylesterase